jgi:carbamoyl-phosphate synthase large subunit
LNLLVTASGSIGAINYVNAMRKSSYAFVPNVKLKIIGTDYYPLNAKMNDLDVFYKSDKHHTPAYFTLIRKLVKDEQIDFVHPSIEAEARVVAIQCPDAPTFLPALETSGFCLSKHLVCNKLADEELAMPSYHYQNEKDRLDELFLLYGSPLWVRLETGAGARGGLACKTPKMIRKWISLIVELGQGKERNFMIQRYLCGADYAFDSIWFKGKLLTSFTRKRLSYLFPHLTLSHLTGTPTVSQIVHNQEVNKRAKSAILSIDKNASGIFCVDFKEDENGIPFVTEVNCKPHSTMFLWSLAGENLAEYYTKIGFNGVPPYVLPEFDLYADGLVLLRTLDAGAFILDGTKKIKLR